jgi:hypothetical protein
LNSAGIDNPLCSLLASPAFLLFDKTMVVCDHAEERLARVEQVVARCERQNAALKAVAVSNVAVIVVEAAPSLVAPPSLRPAPDRRSKPR